jgi:hypothetical protein
MLFHKTAIPYLARPGDLGKNAKTTFDPILRSHDAMISSRFAGADKSRQSTANFTA